MMTRAECNKLLVEGKDERMVLSQLLDVHIVWGQSRKEWPAEIIEQNGVADLLKDGVIQQYLKSPGLTALGIIVDANDSLNERWGVVRKRCLAAFPEIPVDLPSDGLVTTNEEGLRLGVWIMPDNKSSGMLETFLTCLVDSSDSLLPYIETHLQAAKDAGAPFRDAHRDKAKIHSWLAVQDPPGEQMHVAVMRKTLDASSPYCEPFIDWFVKLYEVDRR